MKHETLRAQLDAIADRATRQLKSGRGRAAALAAIGPALLLLLIVPMMALLVQTSRLGAGGEAGNAGWAWIIPLMFLPAIGYVVWRWIESGPMAQIDRAQALGAVDERLAIADRLLTADEFMTRGEGNGFVTAAIDDAVAFIRDAEQSQVQPTDAAMRVTWTQSIAIPATLLLLAGVWYLSGLERVSTSPEPGGAPNVAEVALAERQTPERGDTQDDPEQPDRIDPDRERRSSPSRSHGAPPPTDELPDSIEEASGKMGTGETSESDRASSPSNARGEPSSQGQPAKPGKQTTKKPRKPKPQKPDDAQREQERQEQPDPAGSTAGQGSSRGSNKNPAVSDWSSRDQVATPDVEDATEEDEVDDEEEEQESRGGIQPNLRDRRPPVNRDLNIGFGNRANPDANGRGGPSDRKKSRGVAALVLGVPIPDRIKGQPNPGRTKVTQQRIEPQPETAALAGSETRGARDGAVGELHHPDLHPWMRDIVRTYFLHLRESASDTEPSS